MLDAQLATHYVASERLADLEERIRGMGERAGDLVQLQRLVDEYQVIVEQSVRSAIMTVQLWHRMVHASDCISACGPRVSQPVTFQCQIGLCIDLPSCSG